MSRLSIFVLVILFVAFLLLAACAKKKSLSCNDDTTKETALKHYVKMMIPHEFEMFESGKKGQMKYSKGKLELSDAKEKMVVYLENVRTVDINKDTGRYKCAADFKAAYLQGNTGSIPPVPIFYTSEMTEDGKHYVTVSPFNQ